jgi:hypothetical protein
MKRFLILKGNDIGVIFFLANTIEISKSFCLSLFDVLKKQMQDNPPAAMTICP